MTKNWNSLPGGETMVAIQAMVRLLFAAGRIFLLYPCLNIRFQKMTEKGKGAVSSALSFIIGVLFRGSQCGQRRTRLPLASFTVTVKP